MDARLGWLLFGCAIGFVVGYIVRSLREIKDYVAHDPSLVTHDERMEVHMTKIETAPSPPARKAWLARISEWLKRIRSNNPFVRNGWFNSIAVLLVVALTAWAAIASQVASNKEKDDRHRQDQSIACNKTFLIGLTAALNERTTFSQSQAQANVDLQKAFNVIVTLSLQQPPLSDAEARKAVITYSHALQHFLDVSGKSATKVAQNPYPTPEALQACFARK